VPESRPPAMRASRSATQLTPAAMDKVLARMERALVLVDGAQGSVVKLPLAELNLLVELEAARDIALTVLGKNADDRSTLEAIFGGDCSRISRILAVLDVLHLSEMNAGDQRLATCRNACQSVEQVLADLGLSSALQQAKSKERRRLDVKRQNSLELEAPALDSAPSACAAAPAEEQRAAPASAVGAAEGWDECAWHVLVASVAGNAAMCLERDGEISDALTRYEECDVELCKAIKAAHSAHPDDLPKLVGHQQEVLARMRYLQGLGGQAPEVPIEQHIHPVQLGMHTTLAGKACMAPGAAQPAGGPAPAGQGKSIAFYAALGVAGTALIASGGFLVLGSALGATATAAAGAAGATYCATQPEHVELAAEKAKGAVDGAIDAAAEKARGAVDDATRFVDLAAENWSLPSNPQDDTSTAQFGRDVSGKLSEVQATVKNAATLGAEKARRLSEDVNMTLASVGSTAMDAANAGAETARQFGDGVTAKFVDAGSRAMSRAEEVNDKLGTHVTEKLAAGVEAVLNTAQEVEAKHQVTAKVQAVSERFQEMTETLAASVRQFPSKVSGGYKGTDASL